MKKSFSISHFPVVIGHLNCGIDAFFDSLKMKNDQWKMRNEKFPKVVRLS